MQFIRPVDYMRESWKYHSRQRNNNAIHIMYFNVMQCARCNYPKPLRRVLLDRNANLTQLRAYCTESYMSNYHTFYNRREVGVMWRTRLPPVKPVEQNLEMSWQPYQHETGQRRSVKTCK